MNITGTIPNLFNGVSQQVASLRLPTQGAAQHDLYPSLVQGLVKRPPLEIINDAIESDALDTKGTLWLVDRGADNTDRERCLIYVTHKGITAFRPDGTQKPVTYTGEAKKYLSKGKRNERFSLLTIADHTFISNPSVSVQLGTTVSKTGIPCGVVQIKQASYEAEYEIELVISNSAGNTKTKYTAKCKTWSSMGTQDKPKPQVTIDKITQKLLYELTSQQAYDRIQSDGKDEDELFALPDEDWDVRTDLLFKAEARGGTIFIKPNAGYTVSRLSVTDSEGDQLIKSFTDTVKKFSDLPAKCVDGVLVKVTGDDTTRFNDYYVLFKATEDVDDQTILIRQGKWEECPAPAIRTTIDASTMPHLLVDHGDHFEFKRGDGWKTRTCGDDDTCPLPDFIGYPITGMFQYRNRLGFLSEDVVALSEASEYFNWWNTTAMTQVDSDPIYLSASIEGAPMLRWALPFNEEILFFSDRAQFKLVAPETLSPATAAVNTVSNYSMNNDIRPISNGRNVFFADTQKHTALDKSTRVYEYFLDPDTGSKSVMEITAHVPQYIPATVTDMTCSSGLNLLVMWEQGKNMMWTYKYHWSGNEKLQAAWSDNTFGTKMPRNVIGAEFIGDVLYVLISSADRWYLCKMDFSYTLDNVHDIPSNDGTAPHSFPVYMDMLNDWPFQGVYVEYNDTTVIQIPSYYPKETVGIFDMTMMREIERAGYDEYGNIILHGRYSGTDRLKIGETYMSEYVFSDVYVRGAGAGGQEGSNKISSHMGRLQLQHWRIILGPTGMLIASVEHDDGRKYEYRHTSLHTSKPYHVLGRANMRDADVFEFPVRGDARHVTISLQAPTWMPVTIVSAEWDGNYITKGRQPI